MKARAPADGLGHVRVALAQLAQLLQRVVGPGGALVGGRLLVSLVRVRVRVRVRARARVRVRVRVNTSGSGLGLGLTPG